MQNSGSQFPAVVPQYHMRLLRLQCNASLPLGWYGSNECLRQGVYCIRTSVGDVAAIDDVQDAVAAIDALHQNGDRFEIFAHVGEDIQRLKAHQFMLKPTIMAHH